MSTPGPRRWALSAVDSRSHLLPSDDQSRPIGMLVALCGHAMPYSAPSSGQPSAHPVCGTCEALATLEVPAPVFPAGFPATGPEPGYRSQPRLSVLISRATEAALLEVSITEDLSVTEATRRLLGYGHAVYRADRAGRQIVLRGGGRPTERLVLLDDPAAPDAPTSVFPAPAGLYIPRRQQRPMTIRLPCPDRVGARAARLRAELRQRRDPRPAEDRQ